MYGDLWQNIYDNMFSEEQMSFACVNKLKTPAAKKFFIDEYNAWLNNHI